MSNQQSSASYPPWKQTNKQTVNQRKFLQLICKHKGWRTTDCSEWKSCLSLLWVHNSSPSHTDDYSNCLLLDPPHAGDSGFHPCPSTVTWLLNIRPISVQVTGLYQSKSVFHHTPVCVSTHRICYSITKWKSKTFPFASPLIVTTMSSFTPHIHWTTSAGWKLLEMGQKELSGFYAKSYQSCYY